MELRAADDKVYIVEEGQFDDRALVAFVGGQCHGLALALQEETGWPLVAVDDEEGRCVHMCVRRGDGHLIDITGAHSEEEMATASGGRLRDIDAAEIVRLQTHQRWAAPDVPAAKTWVPGVLERASAPTPLPAMKGKTMRRTFDTEDGRLEVKLEWSGHIEMVVFIRRLPAGSDGWALYDKVKLDRDPASGLYRIDFTAKTFERMTDDWTGLPFDRHKAEHILRRCEAGRQPGS